MTAETILPRLSKVKKTPGGWIAQCPSHEDRMPSLTITEADDGKVLIHCFAGCTPHSILDAVGLTINDLFPDRLPASKSGRHFPAKDILRCLAMESTVVAIAARDVASGKTLSEPDHKRLLRAAQRIHTAMEVAR